MSIAKTQFIPPATEAPVSARKAAAGGRGASPFAGVLARENAPKVEMEQLLRRSDEGVQAQMDRKRAQALVSLAQALEGGGGSALESARNALSVRNLLTLAGNFDMKAPVMPSKAPRPDTAATAGQSGKRAPASKQQPVEDSKAEGLGSLAAQFESGSAGISAIGYDSVGGTSYGKFQIASRVGSMNNFLKFLDTEAPDISARLRAAGPANTGSRRGKMPEAWQKIAADQPERFEALQEKFIHDSHYAPALDALTKAAGINPDQLSPAMQEVLWSTAVQHGPAGAARIFNRAVSRNNNLENTQAERKVIDTVYAIRAEQFGSSTEEVRASVRNRLKQEKALALAMLKQKTAAA